MSKELQKTETQLVQQPIDEKTLKDYLMGSWTELSDEQFRLFVWIAKASNLNPFKREIYAIPYEKNFKNEKWQWEKRIDISIVSWYQIYIDRAMATGNLDWWKVELTKTGAKITIHRKDFKYPFEWEVETKEFAKKNKEGVLIWSWGTMPSFMIKKVAIWQGFRLAFPNEMGWLPYLQEEITSYQEWVEPEKPKNDAKDLEKEKQENYTFYFEALTWKSHTLESLKEIYWEIKTKKFTKENLTELWEIIKNIKSWLEEKVEEEQVKTNEDWIDDTVVNDIKQQEEA